MSELRQTIRMRHESARRRDLIVAEKQQITPNYLSIRFTSDDLADFVSAGADDHIKFIVPGAHSGEGRPPMRDYTPRFFDPQKGEFVIDFALHDNPGPVTAWAIAAKLGDSLSIAGPRGSVVIPDSYDWYWLIGDEAAIPAIIRRMTEWQGQSIRAIIAVDGAQEQVPLPLGAGHSVEWVHRAAKDAGDASALLAQLAGMQLPAGDGFIWIAAEAQVTKQVREHFLELGHPMTQMKAAGYWTRGLADTTAKFE